jgi:hypothetical protein
MKATIAPTPASEPSSEPEDVEPLDRDALMAELSALRTQRFDVDGYLKRNHPDRQADELTDEELAAAVETGRKVAKK